MKIAHLTVVRRLTAGQTKQLAFEVEAQAGIKGVQWTTLVLQSAPGEHGFVRQIPILFRPLFMRNLYGWLVAHRLSRENDYVLMRHITFDPFAFIFAPFIQNRVSVHHSKEIEELKLIAPGWKGRAASALERKTGRFSVRQALAVAGVTREIAEYERDLHCEAKPVCVYPNGVDIKQIALLADMRAPDTVNACFICGTFSAWHGLDRLLDAVDECDAEGSMGLAIHLIGHLSQSQERDIVATARRRQIFHKHGVLAQDAYRTVLEKCDLGIGSLAMDRQNLKEGSTLKVRELLAMGLPIYSTHRDGAIPDKADYYKTDTQVSIVNLKTYAVDAKKMSRREIADASSVYIMKSTQMINIAKFLEGVHYSPSNH